MNNTGRYPASPARVKAAHTQAIPSDVLAETFGVKVPALLSSTRSRSVPPTFQKPQKAPSPSEIERRLAFIRKRQEYYDSFNAAPRALPQKEYDDHEFSRKLDSVMLENDLTRSAAAKVQVMEASQHQVSPREPHPRIRVHVLTPASPLLLPLQKAQARHFDWTKRVYEPISRAVNTAVDASYPTLHTTRQRAFDEYLRASRSSGAVFLDAKVLPGDYNPYAGPGAHVSVKVAVQDPLKHMQAKKHAEDGMVDSRRTVDKLAKSKVMLDATLWTKDAMEATPHGHFEMRTVVNRFADMDTKSNWAFRDFESLHGMTVRPAATGVPRVAELDAEFPIGKRFAGYPYRFQDTTHTITHRSAAGVYDKGDPFSDEPLVDNVIAETMRNAK